MLYSLSMERRNFLERITQLAGSAAIAPLLQTDSAMAQIVAENDARLVSSTAEYDAAGTKVTGYLARLKGGQKRPAVLVIHENRGLNPHTQDVARRAAVEGFLAYAPDMMALPGGLNSPDTVARLAAAVGFLAKHPESTGKVGVVGFCWGGGMVNRLAAAGTSMNAGVPYYGAQIAAEEVPKISAPLLLQYGANDTRINAGIEAYEAALKANKKVYEKFIYEGAGHAFNNDTNTGSYNKEAATLAWERTIKFFKKYLAA